MTRDIPLIVFLTAIGIVLYIYLRSGENTERDVLNDSLHDVTGEMEEHIYNRLMAQTEEPEYFE